jgi:hypothetical protein
MHSAPTLFTACTTLHPKEAKLSKGGLSKNPAIGSSHD